MIEMDDRPFQKAILLVASLIDQQYHDGHFWEPSKSTQVYDKQRTPKPGGGLLSKVVFAERLKEAAYFEMN